MVGMGLAIRNIIFRGVVVCFSTILLQNKVLSQEIDYSKCSCDSISRYVSRLSNKSEYDYGAELDSLNFTSNWQGFKRSILIYNFSGKPRLEYCTYLKESDSIVVNYVVEYGFNLRKDYIKRLHLINATMMIVPLDSIIYSYANNSNVPTINIYRWSIEFDSLNYLFHLSESKYLFGNGFDSLIYKYYLPTELRPSGIAEKIILDKSIKPILHYAVFGDKNGNAHGLFMEYSTSGSIKREINFHHGIRNGKYYYKVGIESDEGNYQDGLPTGKWTYYRKRYLGSQRTRKYVAFFDEKGEQIRGRKLIPLEEKIEFFNLIFK